jgi:hypothetical protein
VMMHRKRSKNEANQGSPQTHELQKIERSYQKRLIQILPPNRRRFDRLNDIQDEIPSEQILEYQGSRIVGCHVHFADRQ